MLTWVGGAPMCFRLGCGKLGSLEAICVGFWQRNGGLLVLVYFCGIQTRMSLGSIESVCVGGIEITRVVVVVWR